MRRLILFACQWPDKNLSSNARVHWSKRSKATKAAKEEAAWSAIAAGVKNLEPAERYDVLVEFYPPDRRQRDKQNMPHLVKAHLDGLAEAMGVDDHCFTPSYVFHEFDGKGGVLFTVGTK